MPAYFLLLWFLITMINCAGNRESLIRKLFCKPNEIQLNSHYKITLTSARFSEKQSCRIEKSNEINCQRFIPKYSSQSLQLCDVHWPNSALQTPRCNFFNIISLRDFQVLVTFYVFLFTFVMLDVGRQRCTESVLRDRKQAT